MFFLTYSSLTHAADPAGRFVEVSEAKLRLLLHNLVVKIDVDEEWYLAKYKDIAQAIAEGHLTSAAQHYQKTGYFEDRFPRSISVDEIWYRQQYRDVDDALTKGRLSSGQEHFERDGFREGRAPYDGWIL